MTKVIRVDINNPDQRGLKIIQDTLDNNGIIIYPTDSVYTMGCRIDNKKAFEKLCFLKAIKTDKATFSIVCSDIKQLSFFAKQLNNYQFKIIKKYLPGPFTFILEASKDSSKYFLHPKKTIGIRIPDIELIKMMIEKNKLPIFSASILQNDDNPYSITADEILDIYKDKVDLIIDGGICGEVPTTIVSIIEEPEILRYGSGNFND